MCTLVTLILPQFSHSMSISLRFIDLLLECLLTFPKRHSLKT
ncbi:hypothetical protein ALT1000_650002 [Alteromonas macleodii]